MSATKRPRNPSWSKDGVGIDIHGNLVLREGPDAPDAVYRGASVKTWCANADKLWQLEATVREQQYAVNARQPHLFLPQAIAQLEERANEAAALRGDGVAGKVMWGQAQAYRDAIALLKSFTNL